MFYLSLLIGYLSILVKTFCSLGLESSLVAEYLQNSKWSDMMLFLGLTCFLVSCDIPLCSPILTFKCSNTFIITRLTAESTLKPINNSRSKIFGILLFNLLCNESCYWPWLFVHLAFQFFLFFRGMTMMYKWHLLFVFLSPHKSSHIIHALQN